MVRLPRVKRRKKTKPEFGEHVEKVFAENRKLNVARAFRLYQPMSAKAGLIAGILLILIAGMLNPASRVRSVSVTGNHILSGDYILETAGVDTESIFYLCLPPVLKLRLEKDPMIENAKVEMAAGNVLRIRIEEKKAVGYRGDDTLTILFADQSTTEMTYDYQTIISEIPKIDGFEEFEQQRRLVNALASLDSDVIADISEITQYSMAYDSETLKILMNTGGYVVAGYDTVYMLKGYSKVYAKQNNHSQCLYAQYKDDSKSVLVSSQCPWDTDNSGKEYWTKADGTALTNKYGDAVIKHYYTTSDGSYAVDDEGKKIPIPVDDDGLEVIDENFQDNYEKGLYSSGFLEAEEDNEEQE